MGTTNLVRTTFGKSIIQRIEFDINQSVNASSQATVNITLGRSDFRRGEIMGYNDVGITDTMRRRLPIDIWFGRNLNEAWAMSGHYDGTDRYPQGFDYSSDNELSFSDFSTNNAAIKFVSARIVGSNLEIVLENTSGSNENINMHFRGAVFSV